MYVWHTSPIHTLDDLKTKEMIVGAQAPGSTQYDYPKLAEKLFGWKFKVITGYEATPKIHLAMERGEVHGTWANWSTLKAISEQWIKDKKIRILERCGRNWNSACANASGLRRSDDKMKTSSTGISFGPDYFPSAPEYFACSWPACRRRR